MSERERAGDLRIARPQDSCEENGDLLVGRDFLSRTLQVSDVRDSDRPFESRGPKEDYNTNTKQGG